MTGKIKINAKGINEGDLMAFTYYTKVKKVYGDHQLVVCDLDDNDNEITVTGKQLLENSFSADQYEREEKNASKTRVAETLIHSPNRPLSVCFLKADGSERVLRGKFVRHEDLMGRSMVEDLDIKSGNRLRQVDHRTIKWLIVDGVKYTVK